MNRLTKTLLLASLMTTSTVLAQPIVQQPLKQNHCLPNASANHQNRTEQLPVDPEFPNPFLRNNGTIVSTKEDWMERRTEILEMLQKYEYGHLDLPAAVECLETPVDSVILSGNFKMIRRSFSLKTGILNDIKYQVNLFFPSTGDGPLPCILTGDLCYGSLLKRLGVENLASLVKRNYIIAEFDRTKFAPDVNLRKDEPDWERKNYDYGALIKWAWGFHRTTDFLFTLNMVDKSKISVTGHSRGGKTALLAGAFDERIALTAPNCSGTCGSGPIRFVDEGGETIDDIATTRFPYWFCSNFRNFLGENRDKLPFDQHSLIAAVAPRAYLSTNDLHDKWANPRGTAQSHLAAREVYIALDAPEKIGIYYDHVRHDQNITKWKALVDFADKIFYGKTPSYDYHLIPFKDLVKGYSWSNPF